MSIVLVILGLCVLSGIIGYIVGVCGETQAKVADVKKPYVIHYKDCFGHEHYETFTTQVSIELWVMRAKDYAFSVDPSTVKVMVLIEV